MVPRMAKEQKLCHRKTNKVRKKITSMKKKKKEEKGEGEGEGRGRGDVQQVRGKGTPTPLLWHCVQRRRGIEAYPIHGR